MKKLTYPTFVQDTKKLQWLNFRYNLAKPVIVFLTL